MPVPERGRRLGPPLGEHTAVLLTRFQLFAPVRAQAAARTFAPGPALADHLRRQVQPVRQPPHRSQRPAIGVAWEARVTHVVDGDSIWVHPEAGGTRQRLRVEGIDAPEICQKLGPEARAAMQALALNQRVRITVSAYDRYGRPLTLLRRRRQWRQRGGACPGRQPGAALEVHALLAAMPQRASAASSATRASTQRAPAGVCSFFQNGAWVFR